MKTKQQCIDEVQDWFDFEYVYECMMLESHYWIHSEQDPAVAHVRQYVRKQMNYVYDKMIHNNSNKEGIFTGGFRVICEQDVEHGLWFCVEFVGADWCTAE